MPKVALVTGGSRGIGLGITKALLEDGYCVSMLATREEPAGLIEDLDKIAKSANSVRYFQGSVDDLSVHSKYISDAVEAWGRVDVLVNNAGVAPSVRAEMLEATPESFDRVLGINLRGPYFLTQEFARTSLRLLEEKASERSGRTPLATIVNVSSISAETISTNRGEYCISKAGVSMATKLWAAALAPLGIVAYEVRPGVIATDMTAAVSAKYDKLFDEGMAPVPRWGLPEDVGAAVRMLARGETPYSTGDVFNVDGGMHIARL